MKKNLKRRMTKKGFTMIEMLVSLFLFSLSVHLMVMVIPQIQTITRQKYDLEDVISFRQVRRVISLAESIVVEEKYLDFFYLQQHATLEIENHQLIKRNGYVLYYEGFDDARFIEKDTCIYFEYEKYGERYERFLGCKT